MNTSYLTESVWNAVVAAFLAVLLLMVSFFVLEPTISRAVDSSEFTITQTVSGAIAFATQPGNVTMSGTLNGLTGGTSNGATYAVVTTNNAGGYNMTISFSSTTAMIRDGAATPEILNFQYSTGTASYPSTFDTSPANAQFGFSVNASTTGDISDVFTNTGGLCGTSNNGGFSSGTCWRGASSTDFTYDTELINRTTPTPASGSTSTILFRISIPNGPNPAVPDGTYTATATLTALDN